jgi:uncharacterized membrane protein YphA (DoxX/SURF4 family)
MNIALWICQVVLAGMFGFAGFMKAFQYEQAKAKLPWVKDFSKGFVTFVGMSELLGALGLILPSLIGILVWLTPLAAFCLAIVMLLAILLHMKREEMQVIGLNAVLLLLSAFVAYGRFML